MRALLVVNVLLGVGAIAFFVVGAWFHFTNTSLRMIERSDISEEAPDEPIMIRAASSANSFLRATQDNYITAVRFGSVADAKPIPMGELWNEDEIVIHETGDYDICINGGLMNLGEMYWQTSNTSVIAGFYDGARSWLGYSDDTCRTPIITGVGRTTITAGTIDGLRRDSVEVIVAEVPVEDWKYEVLSLVNQERVRNGLSKLSWGDACADAAEARARELVELYSHTRPDGSSWSTACVEPSEGVHTEGENLVVGNSAVSPETTVAAWMNSEKHRENILNPAFTKLAVGFYFDPNTQYRTHWSQYFSDF